jgi:hypothetical protein
VWHDLNHDGVKDVGEPRLGGVEVLLKTGDLVLLDTFVTGADGAYSFTGLLPDEYRVEEEDPPGYVSSTPNEVVLVVQPDVTITLDFGDYLEPTATPTATVTPTPTITPTDMPLSFGTFLPLLMRGW